MDRENINGLMEGGTKVNYNFNINIFMCIYIYFYIFKDLLRRIKLMVMENITGQMEEYIKVFIFIFIFK